jgi:hypothetical protein
MSNNDCSEIPVQSALEAYVYKERLTAFYCKHNPSKLSTVEEVLKQSLGNEEELFRRLENKYNPSAARKHDKNALVLLFKQHDPEKLTQVDDILDEFEGRTAEMFKVFNRRYLENGGRRSRAGSAEMMDKKSAREASTATAGRSASALGFFNTSFTNIFSASADAKHSGGKLGHSLEEADQLNGVFSPVAMASGAAEDEDAEDEDADHQSRLRRSTMGLI